MNNVLVDISLCVKLFWVSLVHKLCQLPIVMYFLLREVISIINLY